MPPSGLSENLRSFLYRYIDSVELLEVLFYLLENKSRTMTSQTVGQELRFHPNSVERRLQKLVGLGLVKATPEGYQFAPEDKTTEELVLDLAASYKTHRHRILEIIFSPLKPAFDFADAFRLGKGKKEDRDDG